jgi:hypothetical protein
MSVDNPLAASLTNDSFGVAGDVKIDLSDDEMEFIQELADERNKSYQDGRTTDDNWSSKGGDDIHVQGLMAEFGLMLAYDECELDTSVSASGDGGLDGEIEIDGKKMTYDVKSDDYDGRNPSLMVARKNHEKRSETPDVYISAFVDEGNGIIRFRGWIDSTDLLDADNLATSPAPHLDHHNYDVECSVLESMPEPDVDSGDRIRYSV